MIKIIPREQIKHLEWNTNNPLPANSSNTTNTVPIQNFLNQEVSLDAILTGTPFYDSKISVALQQALEYATPDGYIATMPELISAKIKADKSHDFWQKWYSAHTEENIGIDKKGRFYSKDEPVLVVVNGGGILTPERITKAYEDELIGGSAKYSDNEFDDLLDGKLPNGVTIPLYRFEEINAGKSGLPHQFGIVMPYSLAQGTSSGYHKKDGFTTNPLVIARAGGIENLEAYYELAKDSVGDVGNHHVYDGRDASTPQGRLLYLLNYYSGLYGNNNLDVSGRFVGVAPEAHGAKK
ncbi:MAG: hypothetical protein WC758_03555 [Candidatus Woesearchaeota archaeon]